MLPSPRKPLSTHIDLKTLNATMIQPPTDNQGARRIWSDSQGRLWVSEWNAGKMALYNPTTGKWKEWRLPGNNPMPYAIYVDDKNMVWLVDFGANALVRFDPTKEKFDVFPLPSAGANYVKFLDDQAKYGEQSLEWIN